MGGTVAAMELKTLELCRGRSRKIQSRCLGGFRSVSRRRWNGLWLSSSLDRRRNKHSTP
ncbi:uncharacterized protein BJX67DRAFT_344292 [Aspergillus lucknowensis]|uniref:Uncharacterized protein n=1 Tax=Aspergillus lucknowensis TaxID=176173 RepID=A0ABR4M2K0_9EURO